MATFKIKFELKNYDNLDEKVKRSNDRFHYDRKTFKSKAAAERQVAKYRALDNDKWEITVVEE